MIPPACRDGTVFFQRKISQRCWISSMKLMSLKNSYVYSICICDLIYNTVLLLPWSILCITCTCTWQYYTCVQMCYIAWLQSVVCTTYTLCMLMYTTSHIPGILIVVILHVQVSVSVKLQVILCYYIVVLGD